MRVAGGGAMQGPPAVVAMAEKIPDETLDELLGPLQHLVLWCNQSGPLRLPSLVLQWGFRRSSGCGWSMSL